jgi:hypothetical protein
MVAQEITIRVRHREWFKRLLFRPSVLFRGEVDSPNYQELTGLLLDTLAPITIDFGDIDYAEDVSEIHIKGSDKTLILPFNRILGNTVYLDRKLSNIVGSGNVTVDVILTDW